MSTNINNDQVNNIFDNELRFDSDYILDNNHVKYIQPGVSFEAKKGNKKRVPFAAIVE